jgi:hypothetical protein
MCTPVHEGQLAGHLLLVGRNVLLHLPLKLIYDSICGLNEEVQPKDVGAVVYSSCRSMYRTHPVARQTAYKEAHGCLNHCRESFQL